MIYPVPEPGGLGVHLTLDLGGQAKFGPDVEWVEEIDYRVDPARWAEAASVGMSAKHPTHAHKQMRLTSVSETRWGVGRLPLAQAAALAGATLVVWVLSLCCRVERFYPAVRSYWPGLQDGTLQPCYAGEQLHSWLRSCIACSIAG